MKLFLFSFRLRINSIYVCKSTFALIYWHTKYFLYTFVCVRLCMRSKKINKWMFFFLLQKGKINELKWGKSSHTTHAISYVPATVHAHRSDYNSLITFLHTTFIWLHGHFCYVRWFFLSLPSFWREREKNCSSLVRSVCLSVKCVVIFIKTWSCIVVVVKMDMLDT